MGTKKKKKRAPIRGTTLDDQFFYATAINGDLEQWRILAVEWLSAQKSAKEDAMRACKIFLVDYIHDQKLETKPENFLRAGYVAPCMYKTCLQHNASKRHLMKRYNKIIQLVDFVLKQYFSVEDDYGNLVVPPEFRNPIPKLPGDIHKLKPPPRESTKNVLPYHFICQLREMLCLPTSASFSEWRWAQEAEDTRNGGSWFTVSQEVIDVSDPDCVWRARNATPTERSKGHPKTIYEMWSPVRAVAIYIKLQLPLRLAQIRMLDSGEADTNRYQAGGWVKNMGPLKSGKEMNPVRRGVFRQMTDGIKHISMTGLYINTNKTADEGKEVWDRGYSIPWEHPEVLRWLEKLRDWQEKYNPIAAPTAWTDLEARHLAARRFDWFLQEMGSTCFLFRDAAADNSEDKSKPITDRSIDTLWFKLLRAFEDKCAANNIRAAGNPLIFVNRDSLSTTYYPLHSLRVSLITAYALEGAVPMAILSKCIAGHARLVMTIYYTKAGIQYCTEMMEAATKRLQATEQENFVTWLKDKSYEELEANGAFFDATAIPAMMQAMQYGPSLLKDDKGFCTKGGWGCNSGGIYVNEDTSVVTYGEVPGYPQKNCVRCRWFFTGPAFLDGLVNHLNYLSWQMGDLGERIVKLEAQMNSLEDQRFRCQEADQIFVDQEKLDTLRKVHQAELEKNNRHAENWNATLRLILRCKVITEKKSENDGIQLVAVGDKENIEIAFDDCSKLQQILTVVAGSTVYPECDVRKAVLETANAFDLMLKQNGMKPVLFSLADDERTIMVEHFIKLLVAQTKTIKGAIPFVQGTALLKDLGHDVRAEIAQLAKAMECSKVTEFVQASRKSIANVRSLPSHNHEGSKEIADATG